MADSDRALRWEALLNARDLGGVPAAHGRVVDGAVVRSDALYRLNDSGRAALIAYGVRTVIDMRTDAEVEAKPYAFGPQSGVAYRHVAQQTAEMWEATRGLDRVTTDTTMLELARSRFAAIARAIADAAPGAVLIHCEAGKDRTGLITMLLLDLVGTARDVIAEDYALTALGLAPLFADLIAKAQTAERRARLEEDALCRADVMVAIHETFRSRYGDAEAFLCGGGASREVVDAIRARMLGGPSRTT